MTKPDRESWSGSGWNLGKALGKGTFAHVYRAKNSKTGETGAVKVISKDNEDNTPEVIDAEVEIMRLVTDRMRSSSGVVKLRKVFEDSMNVYVLTDVCHGGTLAEKIQSRGHFAEADARDISRRVLEVLTDLHGQRFIHCDLKPENVLFAKDSDSLTDLKITDFGLSLCETSPSELPLMGSPLYVAPEVLTRQRYSPAVDVWALGILTYHMICGRVPFASDEKTKQNKLRFYHEVWEDVSSNAKNFIRRCLEKNALERATTLELLKHPWLSQSTDASPSCAPKTPPQLQMALGRHLSRKLSLGIVSPAKRMNSGYTAGDLDSSPTAVTRPPPVSRDSHAMGLEEDSIADKELAKLGAEKGDSEDDDDDNERCGQGGAATCHSPVAGYLFSQATGSIPRSQRQPGTPQRKSPLKELDWSSDSDQDSDEDFWRFGAGQRQHSGRIRRMSRKQRHRHSPMDRRTALILQGRGYI